MNKTKLSAILFILLTTFLAVNAESKFTQSLSWQSDPNAYEYKVEVAPVDSAGRKLKSQFFTTSDTKITFSKPAGKYRYRVFAYDFLERESSVSPWLDFEITKALQPKIQKVTEEVVVKIDYVPASGSDSAENKKIKKNTEKTEIPVTVSDVTEATTVSLINIDTNEVVEARLVEKEAEAGEKITVLVVEEIRNGNYKVKITNPGGLDALSDSIVRVNEIDLEQEKLKLEAERIEKERLSKIEEEQEAKRLALIEEENIRLEKERLEKERLAKIEKEKLEAERLAKIEAEKIEAERIEKERLAKIEEEKRIAEELKEADKLAVLEEEKQAKAEKRKTAAKSLLLFAGPQADFNINKSQFFELMDKPVYGGFQARVMILPFKAEQTVEGKIPSRFGFEIGIASGYAKKSSELYEITFLLNEAYVNAVYRIPLAGNSIFGNLKAGLGLLDVEKTTEYSDSSRGKSAGSYGYPMVQGGASLLFTASRLFAFEAGADVSLQMIADMPAVVAKPYIGLGIWF